MSSNINQIRYLDKKLYKMKYTNGTPGIRPSGKMSIIVDGYDR